MHHLRRWAARVPGLMTLARAALNYVRGTQQAFITNKLDAAAAERHVALAAVAWRRRSA